ncbi:FAD-dependent oxidoreductase, partial [Streptomyces sp. SID4931]|nr:FAD-dependent oxidoreductase [Streptomyces sp. SID4931]
MLNHDPLDATAAQDDPDATVVVVGAGLSGLTAARELHRRGVDVIVLEAADRIGGRAMAETTALGSRIDLGGQWIGARSPPDHGPGHRAGCHPVPDAHGNAAPGDRPGPKAAGRVAVGAAGRGRPRRPRRAVVHRNSGPVERLHGRRVAAQAARAHFAQAPGSGRVDLLDGRPRPVLRARDGPDGPAAGRAADHPVHPGRGAGLPAHRGGGDASPTAWPPGLGARVRTG